MTIHLPTLAASTLIAFAVSASMSSATPTSDHAQLVALTRRVDAIERTANTAYSVSNCIRVGTTTIQNQRVLVANPHCGIAT